jgi:hypothetical protein
MKAFGLLVVLAGVVTFVPAQFELQSKLMQPIAGFQPWGGIAAVALGAIVLWAAPKPAPAKKK